MTTTETDRPEASDAPPRLVRLGPLVVVGAFVVVVALVLLRPISDPDAWWHLRLGADLARSWALTDPPAWTPFATQAWVPTQWLPEVVTSWVQAQAGLSGLVWLMCVVGVLIVLGLYVVCRREAGVLAAAVATILAFGAMSPTLTPRPQVVSFVLLVVVTGAWLQTTRDLRPRWWLVPLSWVWACCHGLWFSGPVVGLVVTAGLLCDGRVRGRPAARLLAVPLLSVLVAAVTPVGPRLLLAPFAVGDVTSFITEWQSPSIHDPAPAVMAAVVAFVVVVWTRSPGRPSWTMLFLLGASAFWAAVSVRTVTLGAVMAAPLLAAEIDRLVPRARAAVSRAEIVTLCGSALAGLVLAGVVAATSPALDRPAHVPLALDPTLGALPPGTRLLNDFSLGGWLEYRYPDLDPVVDGRAEAFGADHLRDYGTVVAVQPGWDQIVRRWGVHDAVVATDSPLASALPGQLGWTVLASGDGFTVYADRRAGR